MASKGTWDEFMLDITLYGTETKPWTKPLDDLAKKNGWTPIDGNPVDTVAE